MRIQDVFGEFSDVEAGGGVSFHRMDCRLTGVRSSGSL